jgi:hypothetical protein
MCVTLPLTYRHNTDFCPKTVMVVAILLYRLSDSTLITEYNGSRFVFYHKHNNRHTIGSSCMLTWLLGDVQKAYCKRWAGPSICSIN